MTPERRLSDCNFIQGDEPLESRIQRILDEGLIREFYIDDCEDALFYRKFDCYGGRMLDRALKESRQNLKLRKILAGGNYPEARSAVVEGVDLDELAKIPVSELELTSRAQGRIRQYFGPQDITLADLVEYYHSWLLLEDNAASTDIKEYLYRHKYVVRPEEMPMDENTHIAYLGLPIRIADCLRYPGRVETVDDLIRCCSGNDPVFSLKDTRGIGKKSLETIRIRLTELGFLDNPQ